MRKERRVGRIFELLREMDPVVSSARAPTAIQLEDAGLALGLIREELSKLLPSRAQVPLTQFSAPYSPGSPTSAAAARTIEPSLKSQEGQVLAFIRSRGAYGATDDEIIHALGVDKIRSWPTRRLSLLNKRLVRDSGLTRVSPRSKCAAVVWVAT